MSQDGMSRLEEMVRAVVTGPEGGPESTMTVLADRRIEDADLVSFWPSLLEVSDQESGGDNTTLLCLAWSTQFVLSRHLWSSRP